MWGRPLEHTMSDGEKVNVILLDTEGLGSFQENGT